jgi:signal transduction histidine kinase
MLSQIKKLTIVRKLIIGLFVISLILTGAIYSSYKTSAELYSSFGWVERTYNIKITLESILSNLTTNESEVRGYIITSDEKFIDDFHPTVKTIRDDIAKLKNLTKDSRQQQGISDLDALINERISLFLNSIELKNKGGNTDQVISKVSQGKILMDKIRSRSEQIEQEEQELLTQRKNISYENFQRTNNNILFSCALAFLTVILMVVVFKKDFDERSKIEKMLLELDENKNKFFSIISHDLRGPIHGIAKLASFLKDEKRTSREDALIMGDMIEKTAKKVGNLLEDLLSWAKMQMGRIDYRPEAFEIHELTEKCLSDLKHIADIKKISLKDKVDHAIVFADRNMINTVIRNLVSNSIKFTNEGGEITVSSRPEGKFSEICIEDNGVGMPEIVTENLFKIESVHSSKGTADEAGSGLGLLICKDLIEKNKGTIWVESTENKGSKFFFTIPSQITE